MDGDGAVMRCPPMPEFWRVKYHFTTSFQELRLIQRSFSDMGFGVLACEDDICYIKVHHYQLKYMTLWSLTNGELIHKHKLKVERYIHNTRGERKAWYLTLKQRSQLELTKNKS
jgi:hypothetical protein